MQRGYSAPYCLLDAVATLLKALLLALLLLLPPHVKPSPFDPHPVANRGPFVEGWFARLVDRESNVSAAVIVGVFSPSLAAGGFSAPAGEAWAALLLQRSGVAPVTRQLLLKGPAGGVGVTKGGKPVTR